MTANASGRETADAVDPQLGRMVKVTLLSVPVAVYARAREHSEDLQREFALIHHSQQTGEGSVPARLLELIHSLSSQFGSFSEATYAQLDEAVDRGIERLDVTFVVPEASASAARILGEMFDEADEFCREGDLLTMATPADLVAFRRWFLGEFIRQIAGETPRPLTEE